MAQYLVLARKYRSTTFDEVVGQEPIAQTLVNAIRCGRIAHAYLFTGTRGVGKTTMARILAKALNCLSSESATEKPCNVCDACQAIARGDDVDVVEIDGASNRGIDEIRELRANAIFRPSRSRYKIYYIDEVHMLTKEAFNALLKTLEEPPAHVKFIFATTETEKVPATILSRCQRFDFRNIPTRQIAEHLKTICEAEKVPADSDALFRVARAAAGSMRDALSLMDQLLAGSSGRVTDEDVVRILGTPGDERTLAIARAVAQSQSPVALGELHAVLESGVALHSVVGSLCDTFRNIMIAATCGASSDLIELPEAQKQAVGELAKSFTTPALVQAVGILQTLSRNVRGSSVARALVEAALVRLAEADKFVDPASLIDRLESLAAGRVQSLPPGGQKKNPFLTGGEGASRPVPAAGATAPGGSAARPSAPAPAASPAAASAAPAKLVWEASWLKANWKHVVDALAAANKFQVAGILGPAMVLDFAQGALQLGYASSQQPLLERAQGSLAGVIEEALTQLAGQPVRCGFAVVAASAQPSATTFVPPSAMAISSAERAEIQKDPAVQALLGAFGGELVDIRKTGAMPVSAPEPEDDA